jgi:methylthioribose-1-phosphate isomerase
MEFTYVECATADQVARSIRDLVVRGAPAIGVAAAMGLALTAFHTRENSKEEFVNKLMKDGQRLKEARPTAVNLAWGVDRVLALTKLRNIDTSTLKQRVIAEAQKMADEDVAANQRLSEIGQKLIDNGDVVLTHCKCLML